MKTEITDLELIENLQNHKHIEDSLEELISRHSGIYLDMVNTYASPGNPYIDYNELIQDKEYRIYHSAIKFDKSKGAKFSTYLGNETKWMCLNIYNKNKRRPVWHSEYIENISNNQDLECDTISESIKEDLFNKVLNIIEKHPDKRVEKIFKMRYLIGNKNKVMPWRDIGSEVNLSIQGCINIHNSVIDSLQESLLKEL